MVYVSVLYVGLSCLFSLSLEYESIHTTYSYIMYVLSSYYSLVASRTTKYYCIISAYSSSITSRSYLCIVLLEYTQASVIICILCIQYAYYVVWIVLLLL